MKAIWRIIVNETGSAWVKEEIENREWRFTSIGHFFEAAHHSDLRKISLDDAIKELGGSLYGVRVEISY